MALVLAFLPEPKKADTGAEKNQKLPKAVYAWAGGAFALMLAFYAIPINLAVFLEHNSLGGASTAGLAMSVSTASGFLARLSFAKVRNFTKTLLPVFLFAVIALAYFLLSQAAGLPQVLLATSLLGVGLGWGMPMLFNGATQAGGAGKGVQVMAVVSSLAFFGAIHVADSS